MNKNLSDSTFLKLYSGIIIVNIALLLLWTIWTPDMEGHTMVIKTSGLPNGVEQVVCSGGALLPRALLFFTSSIIFLGTCLVAWRVRYVPKLYQESKTMVNIIIGIGFCLVVIFPATIFENSYLAKILLQSLGILFTTTLILIAFWISKVVKDPEESSISMNTYASKRITQLSTVSSRSKSFRSSNTSPNNKFKESKKSLQKYSSFIQQYVFIEDMLPDNTEKENRNSKERDTAKPEQEYNFDPLIDKFLAHSGKSKGFGGNVHSEYQEYQN